ncbi:von Willebrand factor type A domain protein [Rubripirellula tenax]|uniref:von Willebrand factor type A domain protein n=1 Tax=Rubripirellula tenax TaxID=2528015 RepID=A0A5C6EA28_9BACT|nr:VWA domain-containing protein [Rubripirellula tenax]TWU44611.1 von Willebrand factor type A domain protein [Rubripirellula tenax]
MSLSELQIGSPLRMHLLWVVLAVALIWLLSMASARRAATKFVTSEMRQRVLGRTNQIRNAASLALAITSLALLVAALLDVRWGQVSRPVPQSGIEVMFVLDVSRSMLAEDVTPSRLDRAKQMIKDTIDEMAGDRVGLVLFAGEVKQQIPMTSHYDDFKSRLDEVGPDNLVRGGSRLGDAITVAAVGYLTQTNEHKAMVLVTDGEDMESKPVEAAKRAKEEKGITIFTIGLGDLDAGARIPVKTRTGRSTFVQHDGETVLSKLNGDILARVATETGGAYIPAGTKQVNMADVYHGYIATVEQQEFETTKVDGYEARFVWFLAPAIALLVAQITIAKD